MKLKKTTVIILFATFLPILALTIITINSSNFIVGQKIDSFNNVSVYYNGWISNIEGRKLTKDGYNLGLKYQCVEFVKRYYFEFYNHKMPDSYGHAKDFFNSKVIDGNLNKQRNLFQFHNSSISKPKVNDILVFKGTLSNRYGHVAIVSKVVNGEIEIIQQNAGPFSSPRDKFNLDFENGKWKIGNKRIVGWLRK